MTRALLLSKRPSIANRHWTRAYLKVMVALLRGTFQVAESHASCVTGGTPVSETCQTCNGNRQLGQLNDL